MTAAPESAARWLEGFAPRPGDRRREEPAWLGPVRERARERFARLGFPTTRDEGFRNTSLAPLARAAHAPAPLRPAEELTLKTLAASGLSYPDTVELVFVNGRFAPDLSALRGLPPGVRAGSLASALATADSALPSGELLESALTRIAGDDTAALLALNTALFEDGAVLHVPAGIAVGAPIHLLYLATGSGGSGPRAASYPRTLLVLEAKSQATVIESYAGLGEEPYLTNAVTEAWVGAGATLAHVKLELEGETAAHLGRFEARLERAAALRSHVLTLGGGLVRNDLAVVQADEGTDCALDGLYLLSGGQHADNHTLVDHARPHGTSRQLYKGVLTDRAHGVFHGRVIVRPDAQKTDARQTNRNLLLSREALVDTKPQLEIFADDVKCSHGATIGRLDPDALFYLGSRGIGEAEARSLLVYAFASEVIERVPVAAVRGRLREALSRRLPGGERLKEIA